MGRVLIDSGVDWIKEIPHDWNITKISQKYTLRATKVSDKVYEPLSVTYGGVVPQLENVAKTDAHDARKLVKKDDFAINSRSDRRGACGIADRDGSVSLINIVLKPNDNMVAKYYEFLFHSIQFGDEFYKWGHGIVDDLWTTRWQDMKNISIPVPPLQEQQAIADYLDKKTAEIDEAITEAKSLIDKYKAYKQSIITEAVTKGLKPDVKMKDSGIEWIGEIPGHWKMKKIKSISIFCPKDKFNYALTAIGYAPMNVIKNGSIDAQIIEINKAPTGLTYFADGDIVMAKVTPCFENGNIAIASNLYNGCALGSSELFVLRPTKIEKKFLFYSLQNEHFKAKCCSTMNGTGGLKRVSSSFVENCAIPFPPLSEQQQIADYLDTKCSQIDPIISQKEHLVAQLQKYKKSIIFEYVTGKKEVPNA